MKKIPLFALFVSTLLLFSSFQTEKRKGNGMIEIQERSIRSFSEVKISAGIQLQLKQDSVYSVDVICDSNLQPLLKTEKRGEVLLIYMEQNVNTFSCLRVAVSMPSLEKLFASSASRVRSEGMFRGNNLQLFCSSGAKVTLGLEYETLNCSVHSAGEVAVQGSTDRAMLRCSSGAKIDCNKLTTNCLELFASSGSIAKVFSTKEIHIAASSGSDITVFGHPDSIQTNATSGAGIEVY